MNKKQGTLLTLTMIALLVGIINGIFDIAYNFQRTFEVSVVNEYGESIKVKVLADSGRPPLLWYLAWRVGNNPVTTVNIGVSITPSGTNVGNLKVTYYVKGVSGTNSAKFLSATNLPATNGQQISNSTGNVQIETHLSSWGLSTTQDQIVDYYVYVKVEGDGLISGDHLVAEIAETQFDSVFYDYGVENTDTIVATKDALIKSRYPDNNYGDYYTLEVLAYTTDYARRSLIEFDVSAYQDIKLLTLKLYFDGFMSNGGDYQERTWRIHRITESWEELTVTWNNQPAYSSAYISITHTDLGTGDNFVNIDVTDLYNGGNTIGFLIKDANEADPGDGLKFHSRDNLEGDQYDPQLVITYLDFSANWLYLPLSVVSLPIGQQFIAILFMILAFAVWAVAREKKRGKRRRRR